jgi:hypothetical protein
VDERLDANLLRTTDCPCDWPQRRTKGTLRRGLLVNCHDRMDRMAWVSKHRQPARSSQAPLVAGRRRHDSRKGSGMAKVRRRGGMASWWTSWPHTTRLALLHAHHHSARPAWQRPSLTFPPPPSAIYRPGLFSFVYHCPKGYLHSFPVERASDLLSINSPLHSADSPVETTS